MGTTLSEAIDFEAVTSICLGLTICCCTTSFWLLTFLLGTTSSILMSSSCSCLLMEDEATEAMLGLGGNCLDGGGCEDWVSDDVGSNALFTATD